MKRIIRLTESDLTRLVKRIIEESSTIKDLSPEEIKSLSSFLSYINPKGKKGFWKQDGTKKLSVTIQLSPNDKILNLGGFDIRKPLTWSLYDNTGKKVDMAFFDIFKSNGVIYYSIFDGNSFMKSQVPLINNEEEAVKDFKQVVSSI